MNHINHALNALQSELISNMIEEQEKQGQADTIKNQRLPLKVQVLPLEIANRGITKGMSFEDRFRITKLNKINYAKEQYKKMGIKIIDTYDDLFWNVELPKGWTTRATEHPMWNELIDDKGRLRAKFFYKAAFYDREAFIHFETRFHVQVNHVASPEEDFHIWNMSDYQGTITDGDKVIYATERKAATGEYFEDAKITGSLLNELLCYMQKHYPDYEDINAYWEI